MKGRSEYLTKSEMKKYGGWEDFIKNDLISGNGYELLEELKEPLIELARLNDQYNSEEISDFEFGKKLDRIEGKMYEILAYWFGEMFARFLYFADEGRKL